MQEQPSNTILLFGDGPRGVAIGIMAEALRQSSFAGERDSAQVDCATRARKAYINLVGEEPMPRKLGEQPEYSK